MMGGPLKDEDGRWLKNHHSMRKYKNFVNDFVMKWNKLVPLKANILGGKHK